MLHKRELNYQGVRSLCVKNRKKNYVLTGGDINEDIDNINGACFDNIIPNIQSALDTVKDAVVDFINPTPRKNFEGENVEYVPNQPDKLNVKIINDIEGLNTHAALWIQGEMPDYMKKNILKIVKYYDAHINPSQIHENNEHRRSIAQYLRDILPEVKTYDQLLDKFNITTSEELFAYMLMAYHDLPTDLMLRTTYTYGRILPFERSNEWYDNFRLNAYGNAWNMFMYNRYNSPSTVVIETEEGKKEVEAIKDIKLDYERVCRYLIGSLRMFLLSDLDSTPEQAEQITGGSNLSYEKLSGGGKYQEVCDKCYKQYMFYYGGCHGCDVFDIPSMSLSVEEIHNFLMRYPSAKVGYILNTSTYSSGRGQHWVALMFSHDDVKLLCSQGSNYDCFNDNGKLYNSLNKFWGGKLKHNPDVIQTDGHNCGLYSAISLYSLLRTNDIAQTVKDIGIDMKHFGVEVGKNSSAAIVREKIAGTK